MSAAPAQGYRLPPDRIDDSRNLRTLNRRAGILTRPGSRFESVTSQPEMLT